MYKDNYDLYYIAAKTAQSLKYTLNCIAYNNAVNSNIAAANGDNKTLEKAAVEIGIIERALNGINELYVSSDIVQYIDNETE